MKYTYLLTITSDLDDKVIQIKAHDEESLLSQLNKVDKAKTRYEEMIDLSRDLEEEE